jgi:hypothetical protein
MFLLIVPANSNAIRREAAKYETAFRSEPANLAPFLRPIAQAIA